LSFIIYPILIIKHYPLGSNIHKLVEPMENTPFEVTALQDVSISRLRNATNKGDVDGAISLSEIGNGSSASASRPYGTLEDTKLVRQEINT
jgi:hypothetical protein